MKTDCTMVPFIKFMNYNEHVRCFRLCLSLKMRLVFRFVLLSLESYRRQNQQRLSKLSTYCLMDRRISSLTVCKKKFIVLIVYLSLGTFHSLLSITKTRLCNADPLKPHFYIVKLGFTGVNIFFLISVQKHRLWVLVRTASPRRF